MHVLHSHSPHSTQKPMALALSSQLVHTCRMPHKQKQCLLQHLQNILIGRTVVFRLKTSDFHLPGLIFLLKCSRLLKSPSQSNYPPYRSVCIPGSTPYTSWHSLKHRTKQKILRWWKYLHYYTNKHAFELFSWQVSAKHLIIIQFAFHTSVLKLMMDRSNLNNFKDW